MDGKRIDTYLYEIESCTRSNFLCRIVCMLASVVPTLLFSVIYTLNHGLVRRVRVGVSDNLEISLDLQTTTHNVCQLSHGLYFKYRVTSSLSYQYRGFSRVIFHCIR